MTVSVAELLTMIGAPKTAQTFLGLVGALPPAELPGSPTLVVVVPTNANGAPFADEDGNEWYWEPPTWTLTTEPVLGNVARFAAGLRAVTTTITKAQMAALVAVPAAPEAAAAPVASPPPAAPPAPEVPTVVAAAPTVPAEAPTAPTPHVMVTQAPGGGVAVHVVTAQGSIWTEITRDVGTAVRHVTEWLRAHV